MSQTKAELINAKGDAAFDTDTLYIDSTNNRVGVGTTSPSGILNIDRSDLTVDTWLSVSQSGTEVFSLSQPTTSEIRFATPDLSVDRNFTFFTKGTEAVRIDSSGRVGVGTTSPSEKLEIQDGSISVGSSTNTNSTNVLIDGYGYILSGTKYGRTSIRSTYSNATNAASLDFYVGSGGGTTAEAARIDSSGRLLVGTSTNSGGAKIQASGSIQASYAFRFPSNNRNGGTCKSVAIETISTDGGTNTATAYGNIRYGSGKWVLLAAFGPSGTAVTATTSVGPGATFVFCITDAANNFPTT